MWQNDCVGNYWLHDYHVLNETPKKTREICDRCKHIQVFVKADNTKYFHAHRRDYLQPHDTRFHREWGEPAYDHTRDQEAE